MSERGSIAVASKRSCLTLHIEGPGGAWTESVEDVDSLLIGSGPEAKIRLHDPGVSPLHLLLKSERGRGFRAIDLGSEAGTRLDGVLLRGPVELASGAELRLGNTRIRVDLEDEEPAAPVLQLPLPPERVAAATRVQAEQTAPPQPVPLKDFLPAELRPTETSKVLQVAQMWGDTPLSVQQFRENEPVTIGASKRNRFQVFSPTTAETFTLARGFGTKIRLQLPPDAGLVVSTNGHRRSTAELESERRLVPVAGDSSIRSLELGLHEAAGVTFGNVNFAIRFVRPATAVAASGWDESEYRFFKIGAVCVLAFVALLTGVVLTSPDLRPLDASNTAQKYIRFLVRPQRRAQAEKKKASLAAKAAEKEKLAKEEEKQRTEPSRPGAPARDQKKREEDRRRVMNAGLLGALKGKPGASNIFGPGGLGSGVNNALGGLRSGAGMGNQQGVGGLGSRGSGPGGGGVGLGMGGLGTKGLGTGAGGSGKDGYGSLDLGNRTKESTRIIPGKTIVVGGLSKEVIARVIRSHQHEIKYCYEVELQKNPSLSGKVAVVFTIDPTGVVSDTKVSDTSLHNSATEQCMLARIQRWRFPEPQGGGEVNVTFPWFFKPAGVDVKGQPG